MEIDIMRHQKVSIARRYFFLGFLLLPFLWMVNYCYFKDVIYEPQCHPLVKRYAVLSKWFSIGSLILFIAWIITFWIINDYSWYSGWYMFKHEADSL